MSGKGGSMQASLSSVYEMFRDEDGSGSGVSRSRCKAFLWATGHEVDDEDALDQIMMKYTGTGGSAGVANSMTKSQFVKFVQDAVAVDYGAGDVEESFIELLPPGADTISVARLKSLLAQHGEQMPVDDIDQLIAHVDPAGTGVVSFEQFKEIFQ